MRSYIRHNFFQSREKPFLFTSPRISQYSKIYPKSFVVSDKKRKLPVFDSVIRLKEFYKPDQIQNKSGFDVFEYNPFTDFFPELPDSPINRRIQGCACIPFWISAVLQWPFAVGHVKPPFYSEPFSNSCWCKREKGGEILPLFFCFWFNLIQ